MALGRYSRLSGLDEDQKLDEEMDSLLALPKVNPNQPREWLLIDAQGKTFHALVCLFDAAGRAHHFQLLCALRGLQGALQTAPCL